MEKTIFEKIASGEAPAYTLWQDENFMAFLSIGPLAEGHTLVIPKRNFGNYIFDLTDQEYLDLMKAAKKVATKIQAKTACDRVLMWVEGYEVPHVHVHLIPSFEGKGLRSMSAEAFEEMDSLEAIWNRLKE